MYSAFVVMGYGKKMDYALGQKVDLDYVYDFLIQPAIKKFGSAIKSVRGDELSGSDIIDEKMYELLLSADIVIADIATLNPNAIYELGIRHAARPYSTIILGMSNDSFPFDLNHNRICSYDYRKLRKRLNSEYLLKKQNELCSFIQEVIDNLAIGSPKVDSPFYEFVHDIDGEIKLPAGHSQELLENIYKDDSIRQRMLTAKKRAGQGRFSEASEEYGKLAELNQSEPYFKQQQALMLEKANCLDEAEAVIKQLEPLESIDTEITGIYGAIEKRLFLENKNSHYLNQATLAYRRGYIIGNDYYNGENYVNCLVYKYFDTIKNQDLDIASYSQFLLTQIKLVNKDVIAFANNALKIDPDDYWAYATIAIANFTNNKKQDFKENQDLFMKKCQFSWEKDSFNDTLNLRRKLESN